MYECLLSSVLTFIFCIQIILENYAFPGALVIGTDSHTPNGGKLCLLYMEMHVNPMKQIEDTHISPSPFQKKKMKSRKYPVKANTCTCNV